MLVSSQVLDLAFKGFKTVVTDAMIEAKAYADQIAMTVPSASRDESYGWLGWFPALREWLGPRNVRNLVANGFTIQNRKFESTLDISRDDIADDRRRPSSRCLPKWGRRRDVTRKNWSLAFWHRALRPTAMMGNSSLTPITRCPTRPTRPAR